MLQVLLTQHIVLGVMKQLATTDSLFVSLLEIATQDLPGQHLLLLEMVQTAC